MFSIHRFINVIELPTGRQRPVTIEVIPRSVVGPRVPLRSLKQIALLMCACVPLIAGCASIQGYPADPEATNSTLKSLSPYFDGTQETKYDGLGLNTDARTQKRNEIVSGLMRAYDIEFSKFERQLYGSSNTISVGSDLLGLALGGLAATVGRAATKAALGAASTGVLGANTA